MKLVYLGTPDIAVPPLEALVEAGHEVVLVVTSTDKRRGRGGGTSPSPVKAAALELGLNVSHKVDDVLVAAESAGAELGVVALFLAIDGGVAAEVGAGGAVVAAVASATEDAAGPAPGDAILGV